MNGGTVVAETLRRHDVTFLYTLCGGHISPVLVEARRCGIRVIDVRHEATAVFAADATSRLTGAVGVAVVTAGPGLTNTLTAVRNAAVAESPLVLLGGAAPGVLAGRGALQDIDQQSVMRPHVKWSVYVDRVAGIRPALEKAFGRAQSGTPGPVFVELPVDVLYAESLVREWYAAKASVVDKSLKGRLIRWHIDRRLSKIFATSRGWNPRNRSPEVLRARARDVERCVSLINKSERPVLLVGSQALRRATELESVSAAVSALGIPVYLTGMARGLLGARHELLLRHRRREALRAADLVVLAGVPCDFRLAYGLAINSSAKLISINSNKRQLTMNRRPDVAIHADPGEVIGRLPEVRTRDAGRWVAWLKELRVREDERDSGIADSAGSGPEFVNPLRLLKRIDAVIGDDDVIVVDGGDFAASAAYLTRPRHPLGWLDAGPFGTLGAGAGFALAAKLVHPGSTIWLLYGDGACAFSIAEFDTFVRHEIPILAVVGNDGAWSQIARGQKEMLGDDVATQLRRSDYHLVAQGSGATGFLLTSDDETAPILDAACRCLKDGGPVLVNAMIAVSDFRSGSISM